MSRVHVATFLVLTAASCLAQGPMPLDSDEGPVPVLPVASPSASANAVPVLNENRILGVIPDYQTVNDSGHVVPLTAREKWTLALKETIDPFNVLNAALGAAFSQRDNQTPKYGEGGVNYARRFGAAFGDFGTQNFFSAGLLATVLHQDPRYYRKGPGSGIARRVVYSVSRLVIARQDSGASAFNVSGIGGMMMGIVASNAYYPAASRNGYVMTERISTSLTGGIMGNLLSEFWPDIQKKFFHRKSKD
jgi:hypothetical protein